MNFHVVILVIATVSAYAQAYSPLPRKKNLDDLGRTFVQRFAWSELCDFCYANDTDATGPITRRFNPEDVFPGSLIFSTDCCLNSFFKEMHPKIKNPYILVTLFAGPTLATSAYINDPKIIAWYGNANAEAQQFKKFRVIPIGINRAQDLYKNRHRINQFLTALRNKQKTGLLYANFRIRRYSTDHRMATYNILKDKPFCTISGPKDFEPFMIETAGFKFAISPLGDMYDCYRHWEALLVGAIPIVQESSLNEVFKDLPVIVTKDYSELTEEFLYQKYNELKNKKFKFEKLYMKYWIDMIYKERDEFLATYQR